MDSTKTHRLRCIVPGPLVHARIDALAEQLATVYASSDLLVVHIDEGARPFARELVEGLEARLLLPDTLAIRASRTKGTELVGVQISKTSIGAVAGRDVLLVDDIADEGRTLEAVMELIAEGEPRSIEIAVLVSKHERRRVKLPIGYVGFDVPDGWIVGFGMDLDGAYRDLDYIAIAEPTD